MSSVSRALAGFVAGGAQGALDYDAGVKKEASEVRREEAILKRETALAKYQQEGAMDRTQAQITSSEAISEAGIKSREAIEEKQAAERKVSLGRTPSGWLDQDMVPVTEDRLKTATAEEKKSWYSPKDVAEVNRKAKKAEKAQDHINKVFLKRIESGKSTDAGPKDIQKTMKEMEEAFLFDEGESSASKKQKAVQRMLEIGWTGPLLGGAKPPPGKPGQSPVDSIKAEMQKKLGRKGIPTDPAVQGYKLAPAHKVVEPDTTSVLPEEPDKPEGYKKPDILGGGYEKPANLGKSLLSRLDKAHEYQRRNPLGGNVSDQTAIGALDTIDNTEVEKAKKGLLSASPSIQARVAQGIENKIDAGQQISEKEKIIYEALKQIAKERQTGII